MYKQDLQNNNNWKGGESVYRKLAFVGYGMKEVCDHCGTKEDIIVHHIDENRRNNKRPNLQILCRTCHSTHHMKKKMSDPNYKNPMSGRRHSEETKLKIREKRKLQVMEKGKKRSEETKSKMRAAWSEERREAQRERMMGNNCRKT